jgi:hypothetical protein
LLPYHSNDRRGLVALVGQEEDQVVDVDLLRVMPVLVPEGLPSVAIPTTPVVVQTRGVTGVPAEI